MPLMGYGETVHPAAYQRQNAALAAMSDSEKLSRALDLSEWSRRMLRQALREAVPAATEEELQALYVARLSLCHKRNS